MMMIIMARGILFPGQPVRSETVKEITCFPGCSVSLRPLSLCLLSGRQQAQVYRERCQGVWPRSLLCASTREPWDTVCTVGGVGFKASECVTFSAWRYRAIRFDGKTDGIYIALLSQARYNGCLSFTRSRAHQWRLAATRGTNQLAGTNHNTTNRGNDYLGGKKARVGFGF